ncbi:MAG TPA: DUF6191 domain-containing protein [Jatrophihabitans sp.]|jgi:hypothetical protein
MTQWGLDTLFNPAKRHMDEEKRRLQATREEIGDSSGGKRIDLESGKVTIRRASKSEPGDDSAETDDVDDSAETAAEEGPAAAAAAAAAAADETDSEHPAPS